MPALKTKTSAADALVGIWTVVLTAFIVATLYFARELLIPLALSALLNERAALSPEMALRIEKAFGVSMDTLMRMQNSYDIAQARRRASEIKVARFIAKPGDPSPALT